MTDQFKSGRGGPGRSQGRKKGSKTSDKTERLYDRLTQDELTKVKEFINKIRGKKEC